MRKIVAIAAVVILAVSGCKENPEAPTPRYPACATEDDMRNCFWDAGDRSFIRSDGRTYLETDRVPIGKWFIEYEGRIFVETTDGR